MSFHAYSYATTKDAGNPALQMTLYVIACHVNVETGETYCGIKTLMREAKVKSDRTMRTYLAKLEEKGLINRSKRKRKNGANSTDALELVGFLEWDAIRRGEKITVVEAAAEFTGGVSENVENPTDERQNLPGAPVAHDLPHPPVTHALPDNVNLNLNNKSKTRGRARDPRKGSRRSASKKEITIKPSTDPHEWRAWQEALRKAGQSAIANACKEAGKMTVPTPMPTENQFGEAAE